MSETADLRIRVQTDGVDGAARGLNNLTTAGGRAERSTDSLMGTLGRFAGVIGVTSLAVGGFWKLLNTQRSFDVINAGLLTATGSAEGAALAFEALQEFATKTPYDLAQVSDSFVKLVNLGLTPSERALTSYGNTASAMGKDLNQMIEAVADASTGEMERLKEFGIKASKQGDQITFMFRGVKTVVRNEASEIEDYLIALGENNFAGSMENRMKTLDGALSNLGDAWDQTFLNISQNGVGELMADGVNVALDALQSFNEWLLTGELEGNIASLGVSFQPWIEDAEEATDLILELIGAMVDGIEAEQPGLGDALKKAFTEFPENVRALVQIAATWFAASVEEIKIRAQGLMEEMNAIFSDDTVAQATARWQARVQQNIAVYEDSVVAIMNERNATVESAEAAKKAAMDKAAALKKERDERRKANEGKDRLAGFGMDRPASQGGGDPKADKAAEKRQKEFQSLVDSLRTEEEALADSYSKRRSIIEANTTAESAARQGLMAKLDAWRDKEQADIDEAKTREIDQLRASLMTEEEEILASYEKRKAIVLANIADPAERDAMLLKLQADKDLKLAFEEQERAEKHDRLMQASMTELEMLAQQQAAEIAEQKRGYDEKLINEEEFQANKAAIEKRYADYAAQLQRDRAAMMLQSSGDMLGALGQLFGEFAKGQGKNAERMFKIQKALNMAQAIMSMAAGIMKAQELGAPMSYIETAKIAALGAVQIASIAGQRFSGAHDDGGRIPMGSVGLVGEKGPELVSGPVDVTSRRNTARILGQAEDNAGGSGGVVVNITVNVAADGSSEVKTDAKTKKDDAQSAKELGELISLKARDVIIREQRQGGLLSKTG